MTPAEEGSKPFHVLKLGADKDSAAVVERGFAMEAPVAIEYNGIGYAVMMATPADLIDFAIGFTHSERLVDHAAQIIDVEALAQANGWLLRITLAPDRIGPILARARQRVSESSCGLCGLDSLEQVMRPLPPITARPRASRTAIFAALSAIGDYQPLNRATGAMHGAAFCDATGRIVTVREDVGRHNAFDKLIGALMRETRDPCEGFVLLTARCSYELVEKAVTFGCSLLVTISAPTTLAAERARSHGLTLVALARRDSMLVVSDPHAVFN